jgi:hypothetical protein
LDKTNSGKLSLDRPVTYEIKVPGELSEAWRSWPEGITASVEQGERDYPTTSLVGKIDQAALQGLLRSLYSMGLPLISVKCTDYLPGE